MKFAKWLRSWAGKSSTPVEPRSLTVKARVYQVEGKWSYFIIVGGLEEHWGQTFHCPDFFISEEAAANCLDAQVQLTFTRLKNKDPGMTVTNINSMMIN